MSIGTVELKQKIRQKLTATSQEIKRAMPKDAFGRTCVRVGDRLIPLMPLGINRPPKGTDEAAAAPAVFALPPNSPVAVDHTPEQTPVKDQGDRSTCVSFALVAALEAIIKRTQGVERDFSEQYAHWLFMTRLGETQCAPGPYTVKAAGFLHQAGICEQALCPYLKHSELMANCAAGPSAEARQQAVNGLGAFSSLFDNGLSGWSIRNTSLLESLLVQGFDIVVGLEGTFGLTDPNTGILDVFLDGQGKPWRVRAGHSMLAVGYRRDPINPYFLFKNSWRDPTGNGYMKVSYDYIRQYAACGVVPHQVRTDMPIV